MSKIKEKPSVKRTGANQVNSYHYVGQPTTKTDWATSEPFMRMVGALIFVGLLFVVGKIFGF